MSCIFLFILDIFFSTYCSTLFPTGSYLYGGGLFAIANYFLNIKNDDLSPKQNISERTFSGG